MSEATRLVTAEELEKFPDDDYRYELVEGRVIRMSPVGFPHGATVGRLLALLGAHVHERRLGVVMTELGCKLRSNPDTVLAPDVAFIRHDRIPPNPRGFWTGPPDLAVEVRSPDDRPSEIRAKVDEYLTRGVSLVLAVDPDDRTVTISRRSGITHEQLSESDVLDLDEVVPGFRCRVSDIFAWLGN